MNLLYICTHSVAFLDRKRVLVASKVKVVGVVGLNFSGALPPDPLAIIFPHYSPAPSMEIMLRGP